MYEDGFLTFEVYDSEMDELDKNYPVELEGLYLKIENDRLIQIQTLRLHYDYDDTLDIANCLSKLLRKGMIEIIWGAENIVNSRRIVVEPNKVIEYTLDWKEKVS